MADDTITGYTQPQLCPRQSTQLCWTHFKSWTGCSHTLVVIKQRYRLIIPRHTTHVHGDAWMTESM
jgi:hypothetical protein